MGVFAHYKLCTCAYISIDGAVRYTCHSMGLTVFRTVHSKRQLREPSVATMLVPDSEHSRPLLPRADVETVERMALSHHPRRRVSSVQQCIKNSN